MIQALNTHAKTRINNNSVGFKNLENPTPQTIICDRPIDAFILSHREGVLRQVIIKPQKLQSNLDEPELLQTAPKSTIAQKSKAVLEKGKNGLGTMFNALVPLGESLNALAMLSGIMSDDN